VPVTEGRIAAGVEAFKKMLTVEAPSTFVEKPDSQQINPGATLVKLINH